MRTWITKNSAECENLNWILANTKPCPKCHRPIEKNQVWGVGGWLQASRVVEGVWGSGVGVQASRGVQARRLGFGSTGCGLRADGE